MTTETTDPTTDLFEATIATLAEAAFVPEIEGPLPGSEGTMSDIVERLQAWSDFEHSCGDSISAGLAAEAASAITEAADILIRFEDQWPAVGDWLARYREARGNV